MQTQERAEHPFGGAEIPRSTIERICREYGEFYDLAPEVVERGKATRCFYVAPRQFTDYSIKGTTAWFSALGRFDLVPKITEDIKQGGLVAMFVMDTNNNRWVYTTAKKHIPHELQHSLVSPDFRDAGAFDTIGRKLKDGPAGYHFLEETVIELLTMAYERQEKDLEQLQLSMSDDTYDSVRAWEMKLLLRAMILSRVPGNNFGIDDVAKHFYGRLKPTSAERGSHFLESIRRPTMEIPQLYSRVTRLLYQTINPTIDGND